MPETARTAARGRFAAALAASSFVLVALLSETGSAAALGHHGGQGQGHGAGVIRADPAATVQGVPCNSCGIGT